MKYLSVKDVAEMIKRTPQTIYRWIKEGKVFEPGDFTKVRDGYLIEEDAVTRIINEGKTKI